MYKEHESTELEAVRKYQSWPIGECEFYRGNIDKYIEMMREQYFDYKIKGGFPDHFKYSRNANSLNGKPEYEQLKKVILEDVHKMRVEVITYLKAEGEWKKEWKEGSYK